MNETNNEKSVSGEIQMNYLQGKEFDARLGKRLMLLRHGRKMSMDTLGACIGVCGQQIHKYETGESRVPPERLAACAQMFGVPVGYFFGEGESGPQRRFDKSVLSVAAEVHELPPEIRQGFYGLMKTINKMWEGKEAEESGRRNNDKAA